jgi:hypothetical protein
VDEFDELLDRRISELLSGEPHTSAEETTPALAAYKWLAAELVRVFVEESPSLLAHAQARQLKALRSQARQKRAARRFSPAGILGAHLRWALIAAVALFAVLLANGMTIASASSLPGSPLYPFKRLAEQSNVFLTPAAGERARLWMNLASIRLDEAQLLLSSEQHIPTTTLDAIDQSILYALSEIAGTRGAERLALLQAITRLAMRQQTVLDELAAKASPSERERFQQTRRLLDGVASLADAAQSNPALPQTPSPTPTATDSPVPVLTETPHPSVPSAQVETQTPPYTPTPTAGQTTGAQPGESPEPQKTEKPEPQTAEAPKPHRVETPESQKTETQPSREKETEPSRAERADH